MRLSSPLYLQSPNKHRSKQFTLRESTARAERDRERPIFVFSLCRYVLKLSLLSRTFTAQNPFGLFVFVCILKGLNFRFGSQFSSQKQNNRLWRELQFVFCFDVFGCSEILGSGKERESE
jgi:hypothetical protein